ncbi:mucin-17-like [Thrips palmi]|uniref:Mucin-17-like n=1 Tax=Thrips palmi TaxID=161013 RepID=A0A6P8Y9G1_THRPL|nr:mucin-17-like [Thrips palmi]
MGRGVVTDIPFKTGDFVLEYKGELITGVEGRKREERYSEGPSYLYFFNFEGKELCIDSSAETIYLGRLINHQTPGNFYTKRHVVNGTPRLWFHARRTIEPGEQLFYDYKEDRVEVLKKLPWLAPTSQKKTTKKKNEGTATASTEVSQDSATAVNAFWDSLGLVPARPNALVKSKPSKVSSKAECRTKPNPAKASVKQLSGSKGASSDQIVEAAETTTALRHLSSADVSVLDLQESTTPLAISKVASSDSGQESMPSNECSLAASTSPVSAPNVPNPLVASHEPLAEKQLSSIEGASSGQIVEAAETTTAPPHSSSAGTSVLDIPASTYPLASIKVASSYSGLESMPSNESSLAASTSPVSAPIVPNPLVASHEPLAKKQLSSIEGAFSGQIVEAAETTPVSPPIVSYSIIASHEPPSEKQLSSTEGASSDQIVEAAEATTALPHLSSADVSVLDLQESTTPFAISKVASSELVLKVSSGDEIKAMAEFSEEMKANGDFSGEMKANGDFSEEIKADAVLPEEGSSGQSSDCLNSFLSKYSRGFNRSLPSKCCNIENGRGVIVPRWFDNVCSESALLLKRSECKCLSSGIVVESERASSPQLTFAAPPMSTPQLPSVKVAPNECVMETNSSDDTTAVNTTHLLSAANAKIESNSTMPSCPPAALVQLSNVKGASSDHVVEEAGTASAPPLSSSPGLSVLTNYRPNRQGLSSGIVVESERASSPQLTFAAPPMSTPQLPSVKVAPNECVMETNSSDDTTAVNTTHLLSAANAKIESNSTMPSCPPAALVQLSSVKVSYKYLT